MLMLSMIHSINIDYCPLLQYLGLYNRKAMSFLGGWNQIRMFCLDEFILQSVNHVTLFKKESVLIVVILFS